MKASRAPEIIIKDEIRGICYESGKLYITIPNMCAVIAYDMQTKTIRVLGYNNHGNNVFEKILKYEDKLYLFPANGNNIYYYDLKKREYKNLFMLDSVKYEIDFSNRKFFEVFEYEQIIYAVCRYPNVVICINPLDYIVQVYHLSDELLHSNPMVIEHFPVCICNKALIYAYSSDIAIEFSLTDKEFKLVNLSGEKDEQETEYTMYGMLVNDLGDKWLYNLYGDLFRIVNNKKVRVRIPEELTGTYDDGFNLGQYKINQVLMIEDKLCFIPQFDHKILIYDIRTDAFIWCENPYADWKEGKRKLAYTVCAEMDANSYLLYHYNNSAIYVWNIEEGFTEKIVLKLSVEEIVNDAVLKEYALHYFLREDDLEGYLAYISRTGKDKKMVEEKYYGEKIYQNIEG